MHPQLNLVPISAWLPKASATQPLIISGPCSVESEQQMLETATALASSGKVHLLRGGVWKPRTRPDAFEGLGAACLPWLKAAGEATGLPVATEVAQAKHVEQCLKAGIDVLWIGARTTVNPFSVQEIANALQGVDIPVLVKNPINPDLQLWIGALERINRAGITKLAAIHRGFSPFRKNGYRNDPMWEIPIELKSWCPELDIICDPSHIAGNRELLADVAQKAIDLNMAGLMLESHPDPDNALSDPQQQLTPAALIELLAHLTWRTPNSMNPEFRNRLELLRKQIDEIDADLVDKLAARMAIVEEIGEYKRENDVTILQLDRWEEIMRTRVAAGSVRGLDAEFMKRLLTLVHKESIRRQTEVMNSLRAEEEE